MARPTVQTGQERWATRELRQRHFEYLWRTYEKEHGTAPPGEELRRMREAAKAEYPGRARRG